MRSRTAVASILAVALCACGDPSDLVGPDAAALDAGLDEAGPTRYPPDRIRSPLTPAVAAHLDEIRARHDDVADDVFLKAGASGTVSRNLLYCLAGPAHQPQYRIELDGRDHLEETLAFFRAGRIGEATPFDRATLAAEVGRTAGWVLAGDPSPLDQELDAARPRFGFVNYGTNDMGARATYAGSLALFWERMHLLLDRLEARGVIPIVSGLNPRADDVEAARWVPTWDAATRGLAEARRVPYLSLHVASRDLPDLGLVGDGLHGNVLVEGGAAQPCVFDAAGLQFNYDVRNLESLAALDAVRRTVLAGEPAPDAPALPPVEGTGVEADPWRIDHLDGFTHTADTRDGVAARDGYPDCDAGQDESGPEQVYQLDLAAPAAVRIVVLDREDVDVDVHLLDAAGVCRSRADVAIERTLPAGPHRIVVDSYVSGGAVLAGAYTLVVITCEAGDPACG